MTFLVLCPYVHRPSFDAMWESLAPELRDGALVLDNTRENLGAAGSRNVGARRVLAEGLDWLGDVSPVVRFGAPGGLDFIEQLRAASDAWVVQSSTPVNWHLMAWARGMFERVGLFDENFWPIYGEDGDISRRIHVALAESGKTGAWRCVDADAWITMYGHSQRLAGIVADQPTLWAYYARKWGGASGQERFSRPFGDDSLPLSFWPTPPDGRSIIGGRG